MHFIQNYIQIQLDITGFSIGIILLTCISCLDK